MLDLKHDNHTKLMRSIAILLCLIFIATPFLAGSYICTHAHHECVGAECPICEQLEICTNALHMTKALVVAIVIILSLVKVVSTVVSKYDSLFRIPETLITLQVEILR